MHHQHPVEQRSGMAAARVEEAGEQRIQITRVAKLAHDPAQLGLEPDGATVRQRGLEQRQRGPQLPYGNPALVQWLRSADIAELLGLIRQDRKSTRLNSSH